MPIACPVFNNAESDVIVIGSGPAGLMAAISASSMSASVTVCEQLSSPGLKLLASGGGKCNLTNILPANELAARFGRQWRFMLPALDLMPPEKLREFFFSCGVETFVEDGFHVFPVSRKSSDVLKVLVNKAIDRNVKFCYSCDISELVTENSILKGVRTSGGEVIRAPKVILATGGKGYPKLGGSGGGYKIASQAGHEIVETLPALTGLQTVEDWTASVSGISFKNASVSINIPRYRGVAGQGELLFTHKGISGPAVIDLAGEVSSLLKKHSHVPVRINLFHGWNVAKWMGIFKEWQNSEGKKLVRNLLASYMPHSIADILCSFSSVPELMKASGFSASAREGLAITLTELALNIRCTDGWDKAMVTRGGVSLKKVNPETLESRILNGLFFAGEVLDLEGPCGGFNLQWAFSSGNLAGVSAAKN